MFESITPEQRSHKETGAETSAPRRTFELPGQHSLENAVTDEEAVLRQIEKRAKEYPQQQLSFLDLERTLNLALSDNALDAYKKAGYSFRRGDSDLPFLRLTDLESVLGLLQEFKDRLPNRYQANIKKVLDHEEAIKQIFLDYRRLREKGQGRDAHDVAVLRSTLDELRKIDPDRFPTDLVELTDEERERDRALRDITLRSSE
jgi:hypothetical protein